VFKVYLTLRKLRSNSIANVGRNLIIGDTYARKHITKGRDSSGLKLEPLARGVNPNRKA
jgi:hypothetical protein